MEMGLNFKDINMCTWQVKMLAHLEKAGWQDIANSQILKRVQIMQKDLTKSTCYIST